jgi:dihydrofolate synthase/folylpolyglutamate synthase
VVTVPQRRVAARVIRDAAARLGAELLQVGRQVRYRILASTPAGLRITVRGRRRVHTDVALPLIGRHQALNAAAAIAAAEALADGWARGGPGASTPFALTDHAVRSGLAALRWPARIEIVHERPTVIVDVAHNPVSFQALRDALDDVFAGHRVLLILGVIGTKDIAGIARVIAPRAAAVIATRPHDPRALAPDRVAEAFRPWVGDVRVVGDPLAALEESLRMARPEDVVVAAGSFHVAGPVRAHLIPHDDSVYDRRTHVS